jgi:hypothetical protein
LACRKSCLFRFQLGFFLLEFPLLVQFLFLREKLGCLRVQFPDGFLRLLSFRDGHCNPGFPFRQVAQMNHLLRISGLLRLPEGIFCIGKVDRCEGGCGRVSLGLFIRLACLLQLVFGHLGGTASNGEGKNQT